MIERERIIDTVLTFFKEKWNEYATTINSLEPRQGNVMEEVCTGVYNVNFGEYTEKVHSRMGTVKDGVYTEYKETIPEELNVVRHVPKSDEVASVFPLCVVLPETSEGQYLKDRERVLYLSATIFSRSSWQRSDQDVLYRFVEMINKYTPKALMLHSYDNGAWEQKKIQILPVQERYSLDSYGNDFLLYSTEIRLQVRF